MDPPQQIKEKKTILVVGRMGEGKSAFVNTLTLPHDYHNSVKRIADVPPQVKETLAKVSSSVESATFQCKIYPIHPTHNILPNNEMVYVLDTPGLNSQSSPCLICEQIDNIILENKCQIIGIAYVSNPETREKSKDGKYLIKQLLQFLKIKREIKNQLIFNVLARWDIILANKQDEQIVQIIDDRINLMKDLGITNSTNRIVRWANSFCVKEKTWTNFINDHSEVLVDQWKMLKCQFQNKQKNFIKYNQIQKSIEQFWNKFLLTIYEAFNKKSIGFSDKFSNVDLLLPLDIKNIKMTKKQKLQFLFGYGLSPMATLGIGIQAAGLSLKGMGCSLIGFGILLPVPIALLYRKIKNLKIAELKKQIKQSLNSQSQKQKQNKLLIFLIQQKMRLLIYKKLLKEVFFQDFKITYNVQNASKAYPIVQQHMFAYKSQNQEIPFNLIYEQDKLKKHQILLQITPVTQGNKAKVIKYENQLKENFQDVNGIDKKQRLSSSRKVYYKDQVLQILLRVSVRFPKDSEYPEIIKKACNDIFGSYQKANQKK